MRFCNVSKLDTGYCIARSGISGAGFLLVQGSTEAVK